MLICAMITRFSYIKASMYFFSLEKIALLSILKEVKPSLDRKMIKLLTFDDSFPPLRHSR